MKFKKFLSAALVCAMVLSTMTFAVFAEESTQEELNQAVMNANEDGPVILEKVSGEMQAYSNLSDAIAAAEDNDTITVLEDELDAPGIVIHNKRITVDFNGHTYNVTKELVGSGATKNLAFQLLKGENSFVTFKNGTISSDIAKMIIQNYSNLTLENMTINGNSNVTYAVSNNYGDTFIKNTTINPNSNGFALDVCYWLEGGYDHITVTLDEGSEINGDAELSLYGPMPERDDWMLAVKDATITGKVVKGRGVTGKEAIECSKGYVAVDAENGYLIKSTTTDVVDNAKSTSVEIVMPDLVKNLINNAEETDYSFEEEATYKVQVAEAPVEHVELVERSFDSFEAIDIKVVKVTDDNEEVINVEDQPVTIKLQQPAASESVKVWHIDDAGNVSVVDGATLAEDMQTITFIAPSFSTYVVEYNVAPILVSELTEKVTVVFEETAGEENTYDIVLVSDPDKKINGLRSVDFTFANSNEDVAYTIVPGQYITVSGGEDDRYLFNLDGVGKSSATGNGIVIGKIVLEGYGAGRISVAGVETNIVNTTKLADSVVENYTVAADTLDITNALDYDIAVPTKELTVNVTFNNKITDQVAAYQDMKATITGGGLPSAIVVDFGIDETALSGDTYTFTQELAKGNTYTVTISGAGYRTFKHNVTLNEDKTLNIWNNVKDIDTVVEEGKASKKVTFLAGDIVKDNNINIYDLSAVVSYFGTMTDVNEASAYAKYDLNRDGKIDSEDVAYVLVSWDK